MKLKFTKMHGAGNDYIYVNCLQNPLSGGAELAKRLSHRNFGIGGDGLVLIEPSERAHAFMRMYNADGSEGSMCGNAVRCVAKYLCDRGYVSGDEVEVETRSGIKRISVHRGKDGKVNGATVDMGAPELLPEKIPVRLSGDSIIDREVEVGGSTYRITCVSMGNPHCVVFTDDPERIELEKIGPLFENHSIFPGRVNTEFVAVTGKNSLSMRVWERGSGETLACGTGACAAAVAAVLTGRCSGGSDIEVTLRGGKLIINVGATVLMTGGAVEVYQGETELEERQ